MNVVGNIYWTGRQWFVDDRGIDTLDDKYFIDKSRLVEHDYDEKQDWLRHLAEKEWVDIDDFIAAYCVACIVHRAPVDARLKPSPAEAVMRARKESAHAKSG